jgi:hypothetical protein
MDKGDTEDERGIAQSEFGRAAEAGRGSHDGASWVWFEFHGWPYLVICDYQENRVTLAPEQLRAMMDFLAVRSPEALMKEYETCYAEMERKADEEGSG